MEDFLIHIKWILEFKALFSKRNYVVKYGHKEYPFLIFFPLYLKSDKHIQQGKKSFLNGFALFCLENYPAEYLHLFQVFKA